MGDVLSPFTVSSPPPPSSDSNNNNNNSMPMLYYGLVVVGTAAIVLAIYNLFLLKRSHARSPTSPNGAGTTTIEEVSEITRRLENEQRQLLSSFKYKKEKEELEDFECPVCLSVYEEGEEVRKLPQCKHYFHVLCIDMWLYSHFDCPICRTPVLLAHHHLSPVDAFIESGAIS
ncbi:RING-H2 finger protein ATL52-like [Vigna unguiculata]|uniref:RING-type E3 ubiquitin transferase n=1 Tax=Vigna unguiculata TaxID=3917 RepID=A0A4D6NKT8_VIGUN|nr:RING-H2 finger protein ATL52-like [Vigna unguiculata]QCE13551.1 integrator complex subunit 11 [Vigna unguiculata]